jgi:hypothetical protein
MQAVACLIWFFIRYYTLKQLVSFFLIRIPHVHQLSLFQVQKRRRNPPRPGSLTRLFFCPYPQPRHSERLRFWLRLSAFGSLKIPRYHSNILLIVYFILTLSILCLTFITFSVFPFLFRQIININCFIILEGHESLK